jgi:hypothetical protein
MEEEDVNRVDEANAMRARMKEKTVVLKQKLGKLTAVVNPKLNDHFLS